MNIRRLMNDGHNETSTDERKLIWDEENRLLSGFVTNYWHDASERASERMQTDKSEFSRINIKYIQRIKTSERFKYKASKAFK